MKLVLRAGSFQVQTVFAVILCSLCASSMVSEVEFDSTCLSVINVLMSPRSMFQVERHLSQDCRSNHIHCPFKHVGCQHQVSASRVFFFKYFAA